MAEDGIEVAHEACYSKEYLGNQRHQQDGHRLNFAAEPLLPQQPKSSLTKAHHRPKPRHHRNPTNWGAVGGHGMQAVFLDSDRRRSCGTGVFLPRKVGTDFHPTTKPGCSPVLLPSRVVQALNLNVHELGLQVKPPPDTKNDSKRRVDGNKKGKDATAQPRSQCCAISRSRNNSPEIFLPKEWTY